jgi:hypothetical protein
MLRAIHLIAMFTITAMLLWLNSAAANDAQVASNDGISSTLQP